MVGGMNKGEINGKMGRMKKERERKVWKWTGMREDEWGEEERRERNEKEVKKSRRGREW